MPRTARSLMEGVCYHIRSRGNQKQEVFIDDHDKSKFLFFLRKYKIKFGIKIYSYCIMLTHFHILVDPENTEMLKKFMHGLNMSYAKHFNYKYGKVGHVWQDRFKSSVVAKDSYLFNCVNYIENNPVKAKIVKRPEDYKWSSYRGRNGLENDMLLDVFVA